jgi:hypothetical protein
MLHIYNMSKSLTGNRAYAQGSSHAIGQNRQAPTRWLKTLDKREEPGQAGLEQLDAKSLDLGQAARLEPGMQSWAEWRDVNAIKYSSGMAQLLS